MADISNPLQCTGDGVLMLTGLAFHGQRESCGSLHFNGNPDKAGKKSVGKPVAS